MSPSFQKCWKGIANVKPQQISAVHEDDGVNLT